MTSSSSDPSADAVTATLIVSRTLPQDVGTRQVYVELDGKRIATLLHKETIRAAIRAGHHTLRLDNTLQKKTIEFDAVAGEAIEYRLANSGGRFMVPFLALIGVAPLFLKIERINGKR